MAVSSIQPNLAALINKAYSNDSSATAAAGATAGSTAKKATQDSAETAAGASAQVTLGESGQTTETYTAQGLLQQMRQIQLSNTMLLFGDGEETSDDSNGLLSMMGTPSNPALEALNQPDSGTTPDNAAAMVENAKNSSLKTMLGS